MPPMGMEASYIASSSTARGDAIRLSAVLLGGGSVKRITIAKVLPRI